jgi:hypothetical protein
MAVVKNIVGITDMPARRTAWESSPVSVIPRSTGEFGGQPNGFVAAGL